MTALPVSRQVYVDVDNRQHDHQVEAEQLADLLAATLHDLRLGASGRHAPTSDDAAAATGAVAAIAEHVEVGLAFIAAEEMTALNRQYMGGDGPTDVLAFPIDGVADCTAVPPGQPVLLGDVIICPAVAARSPQPLGDELALLVVHGALHLVGHDHREPGETAEMKALETVLLDRYHRNDPRVPGSGP